MKTANVAEMAEIMKCAPSTVYGLAKQKKIPHFRAGDRLFFDIDAVLAALHVPAEGEFQNRKLDGRRG